MKDFSDIVIDGSKLRKQIERKQLRPAEVARAVGMSRQNLNDLLRNQKRTSAEKILRLCLLLEIDIRALKASAEKILT